MPPANGRENTSADSDAFAFSTPPQSYLGNKGAVEQLARTLAYELAERQIDPASPSTVCDWPLVAEGTRRYRTKKHVG
jgi:hypothetical protein